MRVLIAGAGIAGPTLAFWLHRYGFTVTLVETAPALRTGGYILDFWGPGFEVAERMGILPTLRRLGYAIQHLRVVDAHGRRVAGFPVAPLSQALHGRFLSIAHGDLARTIFATLPPAVELLFDDSIQSLHQDDHAVHLTFRRSPARSFDLLIGADGLHSSVRSLAFGNQPSFERYLGYRAAAFTLPNYTPRDELTYVLYSQLGQQVARFSQRDNRTMFLLTFAHPDPAPIKDRAAQTALLRQRFAHSGWECPRILEDLDSTDDLYFDRVSQIRMNARPQLWTDRRILLLGDAAAAVSLLAGEGSSLAMAAAFLLAAELHRAHGNHLQAFPAYQQRFAPFVLRKQNAAIRLAGLFAPRSRLALFLRNQAFNLMAFPPLAKILSATTFTNTLPLT